MNTISDKELFLLLQNSTDNAVQTELYNRYSLPVLSVIAKFTRQTQDIDDLTQEIFLNLFMASNLSNVKNPKSWIFTIAFNTCKKYFATQNKLNVQPITEHSAELIFDQSMSDIDNQQRAEKVESIKRAVQELKNPEQRKCVEMCYFSNLQYKEIAELLQISEKQVKSHIQNGRSNIKKKLNQLA